MERMPVVAFHIPQKMLEELESLAREKRTTVSDLVRKAVSDLIKDVSKKEVSPDPRKERELRVMEAVNDVAGKINREGIIDKHELYSYLRETHGLSYHEITNKFLISLKEELQRKNLILIENEVGDFVVINIMKLVRGEARARVVASAHSH
jgi:metal-responsive CopG/Arc/MetJ family transcriptional regulator